MIQYYATLADLKIWGLSDGYVNVNDDAGLEKEADVMGAMSIQLRSTNITFTQAPISEKVVQRLGVNVGASDAVLAAQYAALTASSTFQDLNIKVTTHQNIILVDSSIPGGLGPTDYNPATHTIQVPLNNAGVPRPMSTIKADILWEMHNASAKAEFNRIYTKSAVPVLGPASSKVEREKYPYQQAALALSYEWTEWMNVIEHDLKAQKINADPAMGVAPLGGVHVDRGFAPSFAVADKGWYLFPDYLTVQIAAGHTGKYDPLAATPDWKGKRILNIVNSKPSSILKITQQQEQDFLTGKTKKVKKLSNNPFRSDSLIKEAMSGR